MDRMKTFLMYASWVILFILFSELMINLGLEADYKKINGKNLVTQVSIQQAEATRVNGRMKGTIQNKKEDPLEGHYVKIDFYSKRSVLLGSTYVDVKQLKEGEAKEFDIHFKQKEVDSYIITTVEKKQEQEIERLPKDLTRSEILLGTLIALLIFW